MKERKEADFGSPFRAGFKGSKTVWWRPRVSGLVGLGVLATAAHKSPMPLQKESPISQACISCRCSFRQRQHLHLATQLSLCLLRSRLQQSNPRTFIQGPQSNWTRSIPIQARRKKKRPRWMTPTMNRTYSMHSVYMLQRPSFSSHNDRIGAFSLLSCNQVLKPSIGPVHIKNNKCADFTSRTSRSIITRLSHDSLCPRPTIERCAFANASPTFPQTKNESSRVQGNISPCCRTV